MKKAWLVLGVLVLVGCASLVREDLQALFGPSDPTRFDVPTKPTANLLYHRDVQPILDQRCVVCHACYDAPCQLKLSSWEGVARGASKAPVYNGTRLLEAEPTRLYIDAPNASAWREKGFFPVLNEHRQTPAAELQAALLSRVLDQKAKHPLPADKPVSDDLDFSLDREQQCVAPEAFQAYEEKNPLWGMPFGLPALSANEVFTIKQWLAQGAPYEGAVPLPPALHRQVQQWERYFNGDSLRERLVSRYMYEHLFIAHLYFKDDSASAGNRRFFRMVRSATPPGLPTREIATRRPFDDPGVARVYYRLLPVEESISVKSHMPYELSEARMARWNALFYSSDYQVSALPAYTPQIAANPFLTFRDLPSRARYRFMLDEAQFTIMGFIKGPVCRGQTALNVINDHFWVFFVDPDKLPESAADFLKRESRNLALPAERGSQVLAPAAWYAYAKDERRYLQDKSAFLDAAFAPPAAGPDISMFWDGEGQSPNTALTVYRHFDSATVLKGLNGGTPKTAWLFDYSLFERLHYLLVAGYDVFGNIGHQLNTRLYMDFLRMEGEYNFIAMLPSSQREAVRDRWYRAVGSDVKDLVFGKYAYFHRETAIPFKGSEPPEKELMGMLKQRLQTVLPREHALTGIRNAPTRQVLGELAELRGKTLEWMPEVSFLRIDEEDGFETVSLLRNAAHLNVAQLLNDARTLVPAEFSLDVLNGYVGAYPNAFFRLQSKDLPAFREAISTLRSEADYRALVTRFGVRRTSPNFWALSDTLNADYARRAPIEAGLFDYNRLENR